jgi:hypothetical protein
MMDAWQGYLIAILVGMVFMAIIAFAFQQPCNYQWRLRFSPPNLRLISLAEQ